MQDLALPFEIGLFFIENAFLKVHDDSNVLIRIVANNIYYWEIVAINR